MTTTELIPAVGYIRMSSDRQEASPQQQRNEIEKLAAGKYDIVRWYVDEGISGAESDKRSGFKQLIADATTRDDFKAILVWDQDRFSRFDPMEANYYWFQLREAGVSIVSVTQRLLDFSNLGGWLTASVNQHAKAAYLKDLSRNILRARLQKAQAGKWTHPAASYGYAINDGDLVLGDPEKVDTVKWLFEQYANTDVSMLDLAQRLTEKGIPAPKGGPWSKLSVRCILQREAYCGQAAQMRLSKGRFSTVRDGKIVDADGTTTIKPRDEWMMVACPPIVSQALWDRIQAKFEERRRTGVRKARAQGLLSNLLFCGHCGAKMHGSKAPRKHREADMIYVCSSYNEYGKHKCNRNPVRQSAILGYLVPAIQRMLKAPENLERLRAEITRQAESRKQKRPPETKKLKSRLAKLDIEVKAAVADLRRIPDDLYDLAVAEVRELRSNRDALASQLKASEAIAVGCSNRIEETVEQAMTVLDTLSERLTSADPAIAREALRTVFDRVDLTFEHVQHAKQVRSYFKRGVAHLKSYSVDSSHPQEGTRDRNTSCAAHTDDIANESNGLVKCTAQYRRCHPIQHDGTPWRAFPTYCRTERAPAHAARRG